MHVPFHHHHSTFSHEEWVGVRIFFLSLLALAGLGYLVIAMARGDLG